jgi:hypothetical protein
MKKKFSVSLFLPFFLVACAAGHNDFIKIENGNVGTKMFRDKPYKWEDSGELIRADYLVSGLGLTDISEDKDGDIVYHFFVHEILPNTRLEKEWVGQCLIYYIVDSESYIVKEWGFDNGGNSLSCRTFT